MQDQPDTAIYYAYEALDIAIVLHDSSNISNAYKCLSVSCAGNMDCILIIQIIIRLLNHIWRHWKYLMK